MQPNACNDLKSISHPQMYRSRFPASIAIVTTLIMVMGYYNFYNRSNSNPDSVSASHSVVSYHEASTASAEADPRNNSNIEPVLQN